MSEALAKSKQKTVVVFDFVGPPDGKVTELGGKLADELFAALAKHNGGAFVLLDRVQVHKALERNPYAPDVVRSKETADWLAEILKVDAFLWGNITVEGDNLSLNVNAYRVKDGKGITGLKVSTALTPEMKELGNKLIEEHDAAAYPEAGKDGNSYPVCGHCPPVSFSQEVVMRKVNGTILLEAVIGVDGIPRNIKVIVAMPVTHMTEDAIEGVKSWRFKPATGPDGKPVAVRQTIEVTFHLY